MTDTRPATAKRLSKDLEIAELRAALAEAQDQCVELAVDAGELHRVIEDLRAELARVRADRDAWRREAQGSRTGAAA